MATAFYRGSNNIVDRKEFHFTKFAVASLVLAGAAAGFTARPVVDDAIFAVSDSCGRSDVPVNGRFPSFTLGCRLADWRSYGDAAISDACRAFDQAPTDSNAEACFGAPVSF